ncbi:F-box-like protein [Ceratobasidium sp. AG-Ba]|nr:F-box-like protein [Ceratobasidium sp. AG-Ba]
MAQNISDEPARLQSGQSLSAPTGIDCDQARLRLQATSVRMANAIQEYLSACETMHMTCEQPSTGGMARSLALESIDAEFPALVLEQAKLHRAESILRHARNRSKMTSSIYSFPPEILARIFCHAACHCTREETFLRVPLATSPLDITQVCRQWREIAHGHRSLWNHLDLVVADKNPTTYKYPPLALLPPRSQNDLLDINVRCYPSLYNRRESDDDSDEYEDESDESDESDEDPDLSMLSELYLFLRELLSQTRSLFLVFCGLQQHMLTPLANLCFYNPSSVLKSFQVQANRNMSALKLNPTIRRASSNNTAHQNFFLNSLETLRLCNTIPVWSKFNLGNLTELHLEAGEEWSITRSEFVSVLKTIPMLQSLSVDDLSIKKDTGWSSRDTIKLNELRCMACLDHRTDGCLLLAVTAIIVPGPKLVELTVAATLAPEKSRKVLDALRNFVNNSNITSLKVHDGTTGGCLFATQLGSLPRIETLKLGYTRFSNRTQLRTGSDQVRYIQNPVSINPDVPLWPSLRKLYLHVCTLEEAYMVQFLSLHSISSLYLYKCYVEGAHFEPGRPRPMASEVDLKYLSGVVPKVIHSRCRWTA